MSDFLFPDDSDGLFGDEQFLRSPGSVPRRPRTSGQPIYGTARLAREEELPLQTTGDPHETVLREVSLLLDDGAGGTAEVFGRDLVLPERQRNRHLICVGPPGCGKTTEVVLPVLYSDILDRGRTTVVFDPKGDMTPILTAMARKARRRIKILNFTDRNSVGWNPCGASLDLASAADLGFQLVDAAETREKTHDSVFWSNNSRRLYAGILLALSEDPEEEPSIARLREILELPRNQFQAWLQAHIHVPGLDGFAAFLSSGSHNAETILSDAQMRLVPYLDPDLCAVTSADELDLATLGTRPTVLVVQIDETQIHKLRPTYNLFFNRLVDTLLRTSAKYDGVLPIPVSIVVDEFAAGLGRIRHLDDRLNTMRSRRISLLACVQGLDQLRAVYGGDSGKVLVAFSSKIFFAGCEYSDAELASLCGGTMTAEQVVTTTETHPDGTMAEQRTVTPVSRRALLPEEIARPPKHFSLGRPATILLPGEQPFQAWLTPSFQLRGMREVLASARTTKRRRRRKPLEYRAASAKPSRGRTDTRGWSDLLIRKQLAEVLQKIDYDKTTGSARKWWEAFDKENSNQPAMVLRLAEELLARKATVTEFFLAYVYSNTDNIQANLHYLDYTKLKRQEEAKKRRARAKESRRPPQGGDGEGQTTAAGSGVST